jgi:serine phosphatase RsbU (regulator of sigma subunit)
VPREECELALPVGGLLVLYTDGLVEDRVTGLDDGMGRLFTCLAHESSVTTAGDVATHVLHECGHERGADDIALLVARRTD